MFIYWRRNLGECNPAGNLPMSGPLWRWLCWLVMNPLGVLSTICLSYSLILSRNKELSPQYFAALTSRTFYQSWFLIFPCTIFHSIPEKAENFQIENILRTALVDVLGVVLADLALVDLLVVSVDVLDWWGWFCCSPSWLMPLPLHILGISLIKNCLKHNDLNFHHNSHAYNFLNIHNCTYDIWNCMSQHFELHITRSGIAHHNVPGFIQTILEGVFGLTLSILVPKRKWTFSQAELLLHEIFWFEFDLPIIIKVHT